MSLPFDTICCGSLILARQVTEYGLAKAAPLLQVFSYPGHQQRVVRNLENHGGRMSFDDHLSKWIAFIDGVAGTPAAAILVQVDHSAVPLDGS